MRRIGLVGLLAPGKGLSFAGPVVIGVPKKGGAGVAGLVATLGEARFEWVKVAAEWCAVYARSHCRNYMLASTHIGHEGGG